MDQISLEVVRRDKGPDSILNNLRKDGFIPGVLYGNGNQSETIQLNKKEFRKQLKEHGKSSIFYVTISNEQIPVKVNEVQRDPVDGDILHLDLQRVEMDKIVHVMVPIHIFGKSRGVQSGGTIQQQLREIEIKALPSFIPDSIHVNVSDLEIGDAIYVSELSVPEEVEVINDLASVVLTVLPPKMSQEEAEKEEEPKSEPEIVNARDGHGIDAAK